MKLPLSQLKMISLPVFKSLADDGAYRRAISGLRQLPSKYKKLLITVKPALNYAGLDPDIEIIDLYSWLTN